MKTNRSEIKELADSFVSRHIGPRESEIQKMLLIAQEFCFKLQSRSQRSPK